MSEKFIEPDMALAIRIAMFDYGEITPKELSIKYGCTNAYISHARKYGVNTLQSLINLAECMDMKVSELVALGE